MAAVAEMGEVDEMHSKEDVTVNGDLSNDVDMDNQEDSQDAVKQISNDASVEAMEEGDDDALDNEETKENPDVSAASIEDTEINTTVDSTEDNENDGDSQEDEETEKEDDEKDDKSDDEEGDAEENHENEDSQNEMAVDKSDSDKIVEIHDEEDVHEIEDEDDDDESNDEKNNDVLESNSNEKLESNHETIELNDSGGEEEDGDVIVIETPTENGTDDKQKASDVVDLATPEKQPTKKSALNITPRRSTRNLNKSRSYVESDKEEEVPCTQSSEESDIEEVVPQDPLAVGDSISVERVIIDKNNKINSSTIVVKDTKRLVEIAAKTNNSHSGKKEPTLVIIDTNSILSGRGPVPLNNKPAISTSAYSAVLPMALPAQGMYPPNMRATITPIPLSTSSISHQTKSLQSVQHHHQQQQPTPLLPTLTDDMFVVEAPSFIVPYVYEKPPVKDFKEFVKDLKVSIQEMIKNEEKRAEKSDEADDDDKDEKMDTDQTDDDDDNNKKNDKDVVLEQTIKKDAIDDSKKPYSYFESPIGKFFIDIGLNLVQEYVQSDLLKQQKRKRDREGGQNPETDKTIHSLLKNLEFSKENNEPFKMPMKKCEFCSFKTESALAMSYHLETPHMKNFVYRCNFCTYEVRSPHDILFHMEAEHAVKGHLERAPAFHQCPNCPFEDNQKGKLSRHLVACMRKFKPERNLEPPVDWEPPAKIPRVPKMRQQGLNATAAAYQAMSKTSQYQFLSKMQLQSTHPMHRGRGRPSLGSNGKPQQILRPSGMVFKQQTMTGGSVLVPTNYQLSGNQVFQVVGGQELSGRLGNPGQMAFLPNIPSASSTVNLQNQNQSKKPLHQPSISITPLPRASATSSPAVSTKPGDSNSKNSFVICEICDGYIKDLEQLRNHMQWIHKIKIHPKMIYNRPPLNCQKCQFRFFTDQGLERHLLGSHGLVTSSMQDAANKSKDSGRCPVCGRVYQWKLLNHVARDHNMTLKPAHLSYKCTVCTATFGMYKQFENHVYSAHSVVAKRVMDKKSSSKNDQLKPLKINDEITIIPQPAKSTNGASKEGSPSSSTGSNNSRNSTPSTSKSR